MPIAVKRVADGAASNWLNDRLAERDEIECLAPSGVFTPKSLDDDLLLSAGGSGITEPLVLINYPQASFAACGMAVDQEGQPT